MLSPCSGGVESPGKDPELPDSQLIISQRTGKGKGANSDEQWWPLISLEPRPRFCYALCGLPHLQWTHRLTGCNAFAAPVNPYRPRHNPD